MKLTIKYHRVRFFIQWLRCYARHIIGWTKNIPLALRMHLPFDFVIDGLKWNSWRKYRDGAQYFFATPECVWLVGYENFESHFGKKKN